MSAESTKKQQTHKRILDAASQGFRRYGYSGVGVDGIAKAAGVTSGAFYSHLGSKDKAFSAALDAGLNEVIEAIPKIQREAERSWVKAFVDYYLGPAHRKDLACGCAMTTLSPEVVRAGPELHAAYETKMNEIVELVANGFEGGSQNERLARAWAMIGVLIGGLTMVRAMQTEETAEKIAASISNTAVSVANGQHSV